MAFLISMIHPVHCYDEWRACTNSLIRSKFAKKKLLKNCAEAKSMDSRIGISKICSTQCTSKAKIQKEIRRKKFNNRDDQSSLFTIEIFTNMEAFVWKFKRFLFRVKFNSTSIPSQWWMQKEAFNWNIHK